MASVGTGFRPPFCPRPDCDFHRDSRGWGFKRAGFYTRQQRPQRIQRYRCTHCGAAFSSQTFSTGYWLKRPELLAPLFHRLTGCSGLRQIARELGVAPSTLQRLTTRLARHCLLFHQRHRPHRAPAEPLVVDGFETFEFSQFHPTHFHLAAGARSHFFYAFTDSELRRKGRMTAWQKRRRRALERALGCPDPRSIEKEMAQLLRLLAPEGGPLTVLSDEHPAYPRAWRRLTGWTIEHRTTPARQRRDARNPLFPVNLLDLLIRHSSANHKRETIAFSKRRQGAAERLALFQVWRNYMKSFSERRQNETPAQRLGLMAHKLTLDQLLAQRLFPTRIRLPERLARYYRRETPTRARPSSPPAPLVYAF